MLGAQAVNAAASEQSGVDLSGLMASMEEPAAADDIDIGVALRT